LRTHQYQKAERELTWTTADVCPGGQGIGSFDVGWAVNECSYVDGDPVLDGGVFVSEIGCTAKDLDYLVCRLVPVSLDTCIDCECGDLVDVHIECIIENGSNSARRVAWVVGELVQTTGSCTIGTTSCDVELCTDVDPPLQQNTPTAVGFNNTVVQWKCGAAISFVNVVLGSKPTHSECAGFGPNNKCREFGPKCDVQNDFPINPPLKASAIAVCDGENLDITTSVLGDNENYLYRWTHDGATQPLLENQTAIEDVADEGVWKLEVTDGGGCNSTKALLIT
jgi:hypothetical protein